MQATVLRDVPWNAFSFIFFRMFKMVSVMEGEVRGLRRIQFYEQQFDKSLNQQETLAMGALGGEACV